MSDDTTSRAALATGSLAADDTKAAIGQLTRATSEAGYPSTAKEAR